MFRKKTQRRMQLAQLAAKIKDEDHLNQIIRDTQLGFQSAVRSQLEPYLKFELTARQ